MGVLVGSSLLRSGTISDAARSPSFRSCFNFPSFHTHVIRLEIIKLFINCLLAKKHYTKIDDCTLQAPCCQDKMA